MTPLCFLLWWFKLLLSQVVLAGMCCIWVYISPTLLAFGVSIEKSGVILISLSLYVTLLALLSFQLSTSFLCSKCLAIWLLCGEATFFSGPTYLVFCKLLLHISFFRLGKFSSLILLNVFSEPLSLDSSFSIPIILRFGPFIAFQTSQMFCVRDLFLK